MTFPERIETERLILRWPQEADAEEMFARYTHDPVVARYMLWAPHKSATVTREWLRSKVADRDAGKTFNWLITQQSDGMVMGSIGCGKTEGHALQFGYCLAQDAWGQGIATEAVRVMLPIWIADPAIWRVYAYCDPENTASARVLEKAGLTLEGLLRRHAITPNRSPDPRDVYVYAIVRES